MSPNHSPVVESPKMQGTPDHYRKSSPHNSSKNEKLDTSFEVVGQLERTLKEIQTQDKKNRLKKENENAT